MASPTVPPLPDELCGKQGVPEGAHIRKGQLPVPRHLPSRMLAYMEEVYRDVLWPRPRSGYQRQGRAFRWNWDGRTLYYWILEVPCVKKAS